MRRLLVLVFLLSSYFVSGQVKIPVLSSDITVADAMKQSSSEGKLLFIYFHAEWVQLCQWMKTTTFTDPDLSQFLKENALFLELNIETSTGNAEKQFYNVNMLPTMILFDAAGNQLVRISEAMNASKLLSILNTWNLNENKQSQTGNVSNKSANPSLQHLNRPPLLPNQPDQALQYMQQFQRQIEKKVIVTEKEITKEIKQYQIIVRNFSSMEEARAYLPKLRMLNINGEIIKL